MMKFRVRFAAQQLKKGGVISHPTDTIQGLACLPKYEFAIEKIIQLKKRSHAKGLILLSSRADYLLEFVADPAQLDKILPSQTPTTYLLKAKPGISEFLTGNFDTVAVRLTSDPLVDQLCQATCSALISTSANTSGKDTAKSNLDLAKFFAQELDFSIRPRLYNGQASQIINLETGHRLR